jgi:hypothetical protein
MSFDSHQFPETEVKQKIKKKLIINLILDEIAFDVMVFD